MIRISENEGNLFRLTASFKVEGDERISSVYVSANSQPSETYRPGFQVSFYRSNPTLWLPRNNEMWSRIKCLKDQFSQANIITQIKYPHTYCDLQNPQQLGAAMELLEWPQEGRALILEKAEYVGSQQAWEENVVSQQAWERLELEAQGELAEAGNQKQKRELEMRLGRIGKNIGSIFKLAGLPLGDALEMSRRVREVITEELKRKNVPFVVEVENGASPAPEK